MIFVLLNLHQSLIEVFKITQISLKHLYFKNEYCIKILIYFEIDLFYFNQFL
jgi:hypothetical protein